MLWSTENWSLFKEDTWKIVAQVNKKGFKKFNHKNLYTFKFIITAILTTIMTNLKLYVKCVFTKTCTPNLRLIKKKWAFSKIV